MEVIRTIEVINDLGVKISVGDTVKVEADGKVYEGTVKSIKLNTIGIKLNNGSSVGITYKSITKLI